MVARVTPRPWAPGLIGALLLSAASSGGAAESLPDPTRPPAEVLGLPAAEGEAARPAAREKGQGLQVVIIAPGRHAAIINGHTVEVGGKYGDATLIEVREGVAVLRDAHGRRVSLSMFPTVDITRRAMQRGKGAEPNGTEQEPARQGQAPAPREEK